MGIRTIGALQFLELQAYDAWLQWQPADDRIQWPVVIVGIDEDDLRAMGHYPLTDADLAQLLTKLLEYQPRAIGVDIYRDLEQPPGREDLNLVLTSHPNIIAIWAFGDSGPAVGPPPVLSGQLSRVGFADQVIDPHDGMVRRGLLSLDDGETAYLSLGLQLALLHLKAQGITPMTGTDYPECLRLGMTAFRPFESNHGGYVRADARGYQYLLDFKGPRQFPTFSMNEVMSGHLKEKDIRDKTVIVGITAQSKKDYFVCPVDTAIRGVSVHAHAVDQMIRAALVGDAPTAAWPDWQETVWTVSWSVLGGVVGIAVRSMSAYCLWLLGGVLAILLTGYTSLYHGVWIPLVPPALTWLSTASIVVSYRRPPFRVPKRPSSDGPRVFISAKSEDYDHAQQVYDFLLAAQIPTFFSRESLQQRGDADFRKQIDQALDRAQHLVLVISRIEYAQSPWIEAEWGFFVNEIRAGRKRGNILTVSAAHIDTKNLPPALRPFEVIPLTQTGCERLLNYVR